MNKDILKGIKIGLILIISLISILMIVYSNGYHAPFEILSGTFLGNYIFDGSMSFKNSNFETCNNTSIGKIRYENTSNDLKFCDGTSWKIMVNGQ